MPIDLSPFESAMPPAVADELLRGTQEPIRSWRSTASTMYVEDVPLSPPALGWLLGISVLHGIESDFRRARGRWGDVHAAILEAIVVGLGAGRPSKPAQWKEVESFLTGAEQLPDATPAVIAQLCADSRVTARNAGVRLALHVGAKAREALVAARASAKKAAATRLDDALAMFGATAPSAPVADVGRDVALLERLIEAWRADRDPALEPLIWRLGRLLARLRPPLVAAKKTELEMKWHAVAKQPDVVAISELIDATWPIQPKAITDRVYALRDLEPDPRISLALVFRARAWLRERVHDPIVSVLARAPIAALSPYVAAYVPTRCGYDRLIAPIAAWRTRPAPAELLAEARARLGVDIELLLDAVYRTPTAIEARLVLGDALQQLGDPRGELIALQCAIADGVADPAARARVEALVAQHRDEWIGPLPAWTDEPVFERGFLADARIHVDEGDVPLDLREWRTLHTVRWSGMADPSPLVHHLETLRCFVTSSPERLFAAARARKDPFPRLAVLMVEMPSGSLFTNATPDAPLAEMLADANRLGVEALALTRFDRRRLGELLAARASGPAELRVELVGSGQAWLRLRGDTSEVAWCGDKALEWEPPAALLDELAAAGITRVAVYLDEVARATGTIRGREDLAIVDGMPIEPLG